RNRSRMWPSTPRRRSRASGSLVRTGAQWSRSPTTESGEPTPSEAPGCAASLTGWRLSTEAWRYSARRGRGPRAAPRFRVMRMPELPLGTVTLLFTDIEGSTQLVDRLGDRYAQALADHRRLVNEAAERAGGREIDVHGDELSLVFARPLDAIAAAVEAQQ